MYCEFFRLLFLAKHSFCIFQNTWVNHMRFCCSFPHVEDLLWRKVFLMLPEGILTYLFSAPEAYYSTVRKLSSYYSTVRKLSLRIFNIQRLIRGQKEYSLRIFNEYSYFASESSTTHDILSVHWKRDIGRLSSIIKVQY